MPKTWPPITATAAPGPPLVLCPPGRSEQIPRPLWRFRHCPSIPASLHGARLFGKARSPPGSAPAHPGCARPLTPLCARTRLILTLAVSARVLSCRGCPERQIRGRTISCARAIESAPMVALFLAETWAGSRPGDPALQRYDFDAQAQDDSNAGAEQDSAFGGRMTPFTRDSPPAPHTGIRPRRGGRAWVRRKKAALDPGFGCLYGWPIPAHMQRPCGADFTLGGFFAGIRDPAPRWPPIRRDVALHLAGSWGTPGADDSPIMASISK